MVLRASARLQRHYRLKAGKAQLPDQPFLHAWNLDLLPCGRSQLIVLASEEHSLFSFLLPLSRSTDYRLFLAAFQSRLVTLMDKIQLPDPPDTTVYWLRGRTDRRVIGSQNDFLSIAGTVLLEYEKPISSANLEKVEREINHMPMSYLDMDSPDRALWRQRAVITERGS